MAIAKELDVEITPKIADALYVGLVTDTGRFMYENTTAAAHRMAAELIEAGVEPHTVYRALYEDLPFRRLQLLQRALASVERHDDGAMTIAHLTSATTRRPARSRQTPRASWTTCAPSRARGWRCWCASCSRTIARACERSSLRATDGSVDVSRVARAFGGGGHPQAAGFSTGACPSRSWSTSSAGTCASNYAAP